MSVIFRVRPGNEKTVEEIENHYLWFSRSTEYTDKNDSNVFSFVKSNESIESAFKRVYESYPEIAKLSSLSGICCFTEELPDIELIRTFPEGKNGLIIEYDKKLLEQHFLKQYYLGDCFKKIDYLEHPTLFKSLTENDILWEEYEDLQVYKPMTAIISDFKLMDQLFLKMFTRIHWRFANQKELRVILAGSNIPDKSEGIKGYQIQIPKEAIIKIYLHPKIDETILESIKKLGYPIEYLT